MIFTTGVYYGYEGGSEALRLKAEYRRFKQLRKQPDFNIVDFIEQIVQQLPPGQDVDNYRYNYERVIGELQDLDQEYSLRKKMLSGGKYILLTIGLGAIIGELSLAITLGLNYWMIKQLQNRNDKVDEEEQIYFLYGHYFGHHLDFRNRTRSNSPTPSLEEMTNLKF